MCNELTSLRNIGKKYVILTTIPVASIISLSACGAVEYEYEYKYEYEYELEYENDYEITLDLNYAMHQAHQRRQAITIPDGSEMISLFEAHITEPLPDDLSDWREPVILIDIESAKEDVYTFFHILRNRYTGYVYFGGDEVFLPVRDAILSDIAEQGDSITSSLFGQTLVYHLEPVIHDRHFIMWSIGFRHMFGHDVVYYRANNLQYDKTSGGFRNRGSGLLLEAVEGHDIAEIMRLHVSDEGDLFYTAIISDIGMGASLGSIAFTYEGGEIAEYNFVSMPEFYVRTPNDRLGHSIPYVPSFGGMGDIFDEYSDNHHMAVEFLSYVEQVRDKPAVIVDLRGNGGGNPILPYVWIYNLTGEIILGNFVSFFVEHVPLFDVDDVDNEKLMTFLEVFFVEQDAVTNVQRRIIERDQVMIILTDRNIASAAEFFVDLTMNMTNTLIVGAPTNGAMRFGGGWSNYLPNSGLAFRFGWFMALWDEEHFTESMGIMPDIWVDGDALVAAVALLHEAGFGEEITHPY